MTDGVPSSPLRALVIGAGPTTTLLHLPALARLRDQRRLELAVICDLDDQRASAARSRFGFREQSGDAAGALRRSDIDAVYLFGSAQMHFEYGLMALREGKHLFVEKPLAPSYAHLQQLVTTASASGRIAVGGMNRRFFRSLELVNERTGRSRPRFAEVVFHKPELGKRPSFGAGTWLAANGIHALDAMLYMMGGPPSQLTSLASATHEAEPDQFSALMRWPDGAQGTFLCNNSAGARREEYVFHGPGETYTVADAGVVITRNNRSQNFALPLIGDGFDAEHAAFIDAVDGRGVPRHSLQALAPTLLLAELIEQGFSGTFEVPRQPPLTTRRPGKRRAVLVVSSPELLPALTRHLSDYELVSMDDVRSAPAPRADIEAAILGRGSNPLPVEVLDKLPNLRVAGIMALSLARHDPDALLARGVTLLNSTQAYARSVGEFAFALAILGRRRAFASHDVMRAGGWGTRQPQPGLAGSVRALALALRPVARSFGLEAVSLRAWRSAKPVLQPGALPPVPSRDLKGATAGLIGWSANARDLALRLIASEARVLVFSEHAKPHEIAACGAVPASLAQVLAADIVSLHRGLTDQTRHCLGTAELSKLRPGAVLINIARGALIEPAALRARLRKGDIFACLDTFETEPPAGRDPLRRLRNVFLTSHIAGGSPEMHAAAAEEVVMKVAAFLDGQVIGSITGERMRTMS